MGPALAVLAALSFALGSVLQQRGALGTQAAEGDPRFLAEIIRTPIWIAGALCQATGWVLQAVALDHASLVVVQALCTLSLVFALPLGARLTAQRISNRSILGATLTLAGIVAFVAFGRPSSGIDRPPPTAWWSATIGVVSLVGVLAAFASRRRGAPAAALYASAAGVAFAYQAAATKVFVDVVGQGLGAILTTWSTYALIASALAGFALQQSALKTGQLAPALAASNAGTLVMSAVLGAAIFEEHLAGPDGHVVAVAAGLALAVAGILILAAPAAPGGSSPQRPGL